MLARFEVISLSRATSTSRKRLSAPIMGSSIMDITAPAGQTIAANLIAHGAQAYAQKFGGSRAVSARGLKRHLDQSALHILERNSGPQTIIALAIALSRRPTF